MSDIFNTEMLKGIATNVPVVLFCFWLIREQRIKIKEQDKQVASLNEKISTVQQKQFDDLTSLQEERLKEVKVLADIVSKVDSTMENLVEVTKAQPALLTGEISNVLTVVKLELQQAVHEIKKSNGQD